MGGNVATYAYGYDLNYTTGAYTMLGQRVSQTATVPSQGLNNHLTKYEYDPLYQLAKTTYPNVAPFNGEVDSWTYDSIGNRLTNTVNGSTQTYTYQKVTGNTNNWQRLLSDSVKSYTYNGNGDVLTQAGGGSSYNFTWYDDDRLKEITGSATVSYRYDHQRRRSSKVVSGASSAYVYDGLNLVQETGATPGDYLFGPGIDEPLAMSRAGQTYYYSTDALGSVAVITNPAGTVQNSYLFDAWGQTRTQTGSLANPFTYTAREQGEAGSLFYRARYYSPAVGRFLSEDPIGFNGGVNLYMYALAQPLHFTDPTGLSVLLRCRPMGTPQNPSAKSRVANMVGGGHCYMQVACPKLGIPPTLIGYLGIPTGFYVADPSTGNHDGQWNRDGGYTQYLIPPTKPNSCCEFEKCLMASGGSIAGQYIQNYGNRGPNSNTYMAALIRGCGGAPPWEVKEYGFSYTGPILVGPEPPQ